MGREGTAIETPMEVTVRLTLRTDKPYTKTPHFRTATSQVNADEYYCTTGVDTGEFPLRAHVDVWTTNSNMHDLDVREATRSAVRNMITYLVTEHGLDRVEAYMLCSVACDLKMHEVVRGRVLFEFGKWVMEMIIFVAGGHAELCCTRFTFVSACARYAQH